MKKSISKKERDYILFNIRGFFKHYKIEQNINKLSIDISNLQKLEKEVNNTINELTEINTYLINNQLYRTKLLVNRRHKQVTKSTDIVLKKNVENKQKIKLNELKYDLNKSNFTSRPKTPDVSQIFNKYKRKKNNTNIGLKHNYNIIEQNNKMGNSSFMTAKNSLKKTNENNSSKSNNIINKSNQYIGYNKLKNKNERENRIDNKIKDNSVKTLNYMMTTIPKDYEKITKQKNIKKISGDLSPIKTISKKEKEKDKDKDNKLELTNSKKNKSKEKEIYINKLIKKKKIKKVNTNIERFYSSDIAQRTINNEKKEILKNMMDKKISKKIVKVDNKKRLKIYLNKNELLIKTF